MAGFRSTVYSAVNQHHSRVYIDVKPRPSGIHVRSVDRKSRAERIRDDGPELDDFVALLRALALPCELVQAEAYGSEFAVVLRKTGA